MSINRSLYIGLSGMNANSLALNVIGDNIANMNTVGYKAGRSVFQEMLGQSLMGSSGPSMVGGGVGLAQVEKVFQQGSLLGTGGEWDLAIGGEGFFATQGEVDGVNGVFYTRSGQFGKDKDGFITNPMGLKLMGYTANGAGEIQSGLGAIQIDDSPIPPTPTTKIDLSVNLKNNTLPGTFDVNDKDNTNNFHSPVTVYDAQGAAHEVDVIWTKSEADNTWTYNAVLDGSDVSGGVAKEPVVVGSGTAEFDSTGKMTLDPKAMVIKFTPPGGQEQTIQMDITGTTQYANKESSIVKKDQDGSQAGTFQSVTIDTDGKIVGAFTNGEEKVLGQIALARFNSNGGLRATGGGMFASSLDSGSVIMGGANSNGRGQIVSGALEQSTVDIAAEFTNMIIAQRGYQANSRTISTADQVMQEAVNLKR